MSSPRERDDRFLDANLRRFARAQRWAFKPTPEQLLRWKSGAAVRVRLASPRLGLFRTRWLAAFISSAAAAIALYSVLVVAPGASRVQASTILHDLRQRLYEGFAITLEHVGDEGFRVDGQIVLGFGPPPLDAPVTAPGRQAESVFVDARVRANEHAEHRPFIDVETVGALRADSQWVYLRLNGFSDTLLEKYPLAIPLAVLAKNGILIELDGFGQTLRLAAALLQPAWVGPPAPERSPAAPSPTLPAPSDAPAELEQLLDSFVFGRADLAQVDRLVSLMAQSARDVRLESSRSGRHVLYATGFGPLSSAAAPVPLDDLTLEIIYVEGLGIESAVIRNVGLYRGVVRLTPAPTAQQAPLFDRERFIAGGKTTVWKLSDLDQAIFTVLTEFLPVPLAAASGGN